MSDNFFSGSPSLRRNAVTSAAALMMLVAGVAFSIRGGTSTSNYIEYKKEVIVCTATGGLEQYPYCNWQEPKSDSGSGSVITGIYYTIGHSPVPIGVDFTIGPSATVSGSIAIKNLTDITTSSGLTVVNLTGAYLINSGSYLRAVTLKNPGLGHTASMMIEYYTRLSR